MRFHGRAQSPIVTSATRDPSERGSLHGQHAGFREVSEVVFALPFSFEHEDYVQILTDMAEKLGPALGWSSAG